MKYQSGVFAVFVLGTLAGVACSIKDYSHERIFKDGDIILGGIFPLHLVKDNDSCSDLRSNMLILSEAMIYAVDEITKEGKILQTVSLGYDIRDTCGKEQEGVSIATDFVYENTLKFDQRFAVTNSCRTEVTTPNRQPVMAVIGGMDSRVSVNVANVLQVEDVPQISYGATSSELADAEFTSFFRTVPGDNFQSRAMTEFIAHFQWTCVAVIGVDDWYGRSGVSALVTAANETGICIVLKEFFPVHDSETQIEKLVARVKLMEQVQIIILYSLVPQAILVFEEAVRQDLTGKTWIASDGWSDSSLIQQPRYKPIIQGAIGFGFHAVRFPEFEKHVKRVTPLMQKGSWWNEFWQNEFNCTAVNFSSALHEPCTGQERVTAEMYEERFSRGEAAYVRDAVYSAAVGLKDLLNCDINGPKCSSASVSGLRPEDLLANLKKVSFKGLTGQINYRIGEVEAAYDIFNLQETKQGGFDLVKIGVWNGTNKQKLMVQYDLVQWHNGTKPRTTCGEICKAGSFRSTPNQCFWECVPCDLDTVSEHSESTECRACPKGFISNPDNTKCDEVPIKFIEWGEPWGVALATLTAACVLFTLVVLAIVIQKRKMPIIKETGGFLNILFLVVALLSYAFNLVHLSKPSDLGCRVLPPGFYLIYTGAALVQFLKVYRIRALLKPPTPPATHTKQQVYIMVGTLWTFLFLVSLAWVLVDPPQCDKHFVSRLVVYAVCTKYQTNLGLVLRYFCVVCLALTIFAAMVAAYNTKSLPHGQRFDEAKHLAFSLTVFAVTFATFYPGWALIKGPSLTVFACKTNIVAATGTVLCIFGPKLWLIYRFPRHNTRTYVRPTPFQAREVRSSTLLSIGKIAMVVTSSEGKGSPTLGQR